MSSDSKYKKAKKIVKKKKEFYSHLSIFLATGLFFFLMNIATNNGFLFDDVWFHFPMIPWFLGLSIHYLTVFGLPGRDKILSEEWEEREIQKEMHKLGGEVEDDYLDLNEKQILKKRQAADWKDSDFV